MIRKYGSSSVKYVSSQEELKWMTPLKVIGDSVVRFRMYP